MARSHQFLNQAIFKIEASGIRKAFDLAAKIKNPLNLSIGEPDFFMPKIAKKSAIKAIEKNYTKYTQTQGLLALKEKITQKLWKENKIKANTRDILVTAGIAGGLHLAFSVLVNPGDEVLMSNPFFVIYDQLTKFFGGKPIYFNTFPDFRPKIKEIELKITSKTKILVLNSPANPTGVVYTKKEIKEFIAIAKKYNLLIISDEIYEKFIYDKVKHISPGQFYKNTLTFGGFSKTYAMTGLRIGYVTGPTEIIQAMTKLQQYTYVCAPSVSQHTALAAMETNTSKQIENYQKKRDFIYNQLKDYYKITKPEGAFYFFIKTPNNTNDMEFCEKAISKKLLLVPGSIFCNRNDYFRLSYATSDKVLKKAVRVLQNLAKL